jgi:hypothetical protein
MSFQIVNYLEKSVLVKEISATLMPEFVIIES